MKLATFRRGGVHPADRKELSKDKAIERLPLPSELIVSMSQHLGAPATPLKKKGDTVRKGEVIGSASSYVSADVHSPADGVVTDIRKVRVASGAVADAIVTMRSNRTRSQKAMTGGARAPRSFSSSSDPWASSEWAELRSRQMSNLPFRWARRSMLLS